MANMKWDTAIQKAMVDAGKPIHYTDIAEIIAEKEYRQKLGSTPANTINVTINSSLKKLGDRSPYIRTEPGHYTLKELASQHSADPDSLEQEVKQKRQATGLIQCVGMFWNADKVIWKSNPSIYGRETAKSDPIDFAAQRGVYLLHDRDRVIYVGRATDGDLGQRLFAHTQNRLNGRWDRFSWFGLLGVGENGALTEIDLNFGISELISTMEAVLIESMEPVQNRRRGDHFAALEFIQADDPSFEKRRKEALLNELKRAF